ncbi:MAG: hypothetical protein PUD38_08530 [Firmicutes bacterium]|nr:hypothetical protein [Bacillota bacterium]
MKQSRKHWGILLALLTVCVLLFMLIANIIQTDHGRVRISTEAFSLNDGIITYKLYRPETATADSPAPAVLLLHGYQNDKDTCDAYAIELARRGAVVMAIDEYGHGSTTLGMRNRGSVNHKLSVNYGTEGVQVKEISGTGRYKLMMNFSNLDFFNQVYSQDEQGNALLDTSMGGAAAYGLLSSFDFVDATRMGVSGHSMGTWASWSVAAAWSGAVDGQGQDISPKCVVLQCGELFYDAAFDEKDIRFNNVLLLQAKYDEFNYFRDYQNTVSDALLISPLRQEFLGTDAGQWNTTYGDFADGSARRVELLITNHRLTTHDAHGMRAAMEWFDSAIDLPTTLDAADHVYGMKENLGLLAMLTAIVAMIPLLELLLTTPFFDKVSFTLPERPYRVLNGRKWWKGAWITVLIAGLTYPFMTQLGHALLPLPENIFRMTIGNGFLGWYGLLIIIMLLTTIIPYRRSKKRDNPMDYVDLGLSRPERAGKLDWALCGKGALLAAAMVGYLYLITISCTALFGLDLRYIWPFFRGFSSARFGQFLVYLPVFALFFVLNNSKIFAQMRTAATEKSGVKGFLSNWWRNAFCMVGGVLLLMLLEYIPFFAEIGPGADLLFSPTFGGPFMSLMIVFVPQVLVFSLICTYTYRRTKSVYVGAFTAAMMACWIVTGGSAMF